MNKKTGRKIILSLLLLSLMLPAGCGAGKNPSAPKDRVILDCDMGIMNDDALALSMLLQGEKQGKYEVIGITLEGGNFFIDASFETAGVLQTCEWDNINQFLESADRTDIPVYKGTDYPLGYTEDTISQLSVHFDNADYLPFNDDYGAIHAFTNTVSGALCESDDAADFLIESVGKYPGNVIIIAIGPTMNVAKAVRKDPAFAENVKAVYYMGGALGDCYETETIRGEKVMAVAGANVTPYAEYNALYDPSALFTCLTAGFPMQYITPAELNVAYDELASAGLTEAAKDNVIAAMWKKQYETSLPEYPYWDPVTAFVYLQPECIVNAEERYITVLTDMEDLRYGQTTAISVDEYEALPDNEKTEYGKITVIHEIEHFWEETVSLLLF